MRGDKYQRNSNIAQIGNRMQLTKTRIACAKLLGPFFISGSAYKLF